MLPGKTGGRRVPDHRRAYTPHFIRRDGHADAGATNENPLPLLAHHCVGNPFCELWVIDGLLAETPRSSNRRSGNSFFKASSSDFLRAKPAWSDPTKIGFTAEFDVAWGDIGISGTNYYS